MRSFHSRKYVFSHRVEAMSLGISHVFLVVLISPLMLLAIRLIESTLQTYTGMTFNQIFSGEVGAQALVAFLVAFLSIVVATHAMRSVFVERIYGRIAVNFSVTGMAVASWLFALYLGRNGPAYLGGFSQSVLVTLFALLPFVHFFVLRTVLARLQK